MQGDETLEPSPHARLKPLSLTEIRNQQARRYLIKSLLGAGEMSVWYGDAGCGKSFLMLETARCIATGQPWFDKKTTQGAVLYIMCEGGGGAGKRIEAMRLAHGFYDNAPIFITPVSTRLLNAPEDVAGIIYWAKTVEAVLIVIDTLNRAMNAGNENDSKDMGGFICNCDEIREKTGAHVAIVHHNGSNKDKKGRGHTSLEGAADTMVRVEKHLSGNSATVTKNKDDEDGWNVGFQLDVIEVGADEDGDVITSCAVVPADVEIEKKERRPTGDQKMARDALEEVLIGSGRTINHRHGIPDNTVCADFEAWRQEFYARASDKPTHEASARHSVGPQRP